jgi:hypothetical protein
MDDDGREKDKHGEHGRRPKRNPFCLRMDSESTCKRSSHGYENQTGVWSARRGKGGLDTKRGDKRMTRGLTGHLLRGRRVVNAYPSDE